MRPPNARSIAECSISHSRIRNVPLPRLLPTQLRPIGRKNESCSQTLRATTRSPSKEPYVTSRVLRGASRTQLKRCRVPRTSLCCVPANRRKLTEHVRPLIVIVDLPSQSSEPVPRPQVVASALIRVFHV